MIRYLLNRYHAALSRRYTELARAEGTPIELQVSFITASNWHARQVQP